MAGFITKCKNCCFYNSDNHTCKNNLHQIFRDRKAVFTTEDESTVIDRICPYRRNAYWEVEKSDNEKIKIINDEIYISGTIVLITSNESDLKSTLDKLNENKHIDRFNYIIIYNNIKSSNILHICNTNIKTKYRLILKINDDISLQVFNSLKYSKNGFLFIIECNKPVQDNLIDKVDNLINRKLFRILHINATDGVHEAVSMLHIYKYLKGDLDIPFSEKLIDISKQENSDPQVFNWKEVNEQYTN